MTPITVLFGFRREIQNSTDPPHTYKKKTTSQAIGSDELKGIKNNLSGNRFR